MKTYKNYHWEFGYTSYLSTVIYTYEGKALTYTHVLNLGWVALVWHTTIVVQSRIDNSIYRMEKMKWTILVVN